MRKFKIYKEDGELITAFQFIKAETAEEAIQKAKESFPKSLGEHNLTAVELEDIYGGI